MAKIRTTPEKKKESDTGKSRFYCCCQRKMATCGMPVITSDPFDESVIYADEALHYNFDLLHQPERWEFKDPVVPFCRAFLDPIVPKTDILICGTVAKEAIKFTINFCLDPLRGGDIAFHFNPRFDQNYVARNSLLKDHWGNEEAHAIKRNPFKRGEPFILEFFVTRHEFLVSVNGSHFCSYTHRVPPLEIQQIEIDGDLSLKRVELSTKDFYPSAFGIAEDLAISDAMECPITYQLPGELAFGRMIRIDGKVKLLPSVFYVNVQAGRLYWPHPQVGFHTSVRFIETGGSAVTTHRPTVILNSWQDTSWGPEKELQLTDLALLPGSSFCLIVNCGPNAFNATLNNRPLGKVKYFMELKGLNILHIQGDIVINSIQVT